MGNYLCGRTSNGKAQKQVQDVWQDPPFKVVRPDGTIEVFRRSVTTWELLNQHPNHSVFHSSAIMPPVSPSSALPLDKELEGGRLYYILPIENSLHQKGQASPKGWVNPLAKVAVAYSSSGSFPKPVEGKAARLLGNSWKPKLETINEMGDSSGRHVHYPRSQR